MYVDCQVFHSCSSSLDSDTIVGNLITWQRNLGNYHDNNKMCGVIVVKVKKWRQCHGMGKTHSNHRRSGNTVVGVRLLLFMIFQ